MTAVGPVVFQVKVNGTVINESPLDFELRQAWGNHDLFFIRLVVPKLKPNKSLLKAWADGSPVEILWGRQPTSVSTWYGYINHHESSSTDDQKLGLWQMTYVIIGSSKVLNGHNSRTWKGMTAAGIAQTIAGANGFRAVVTQSTWVLPLEIQSNESDFQFLTRIADKVGFRFWVSGGTLYLIDPLVLVSAGTSYVVPHYVINKALYVQDTAVNFKVVQGDNIPGSVKMNRTIYGVDSSGVYAVTASGDSYQDSNIDSSRYVASRSEAQSIVNANKSLAQFWIQATVDVFGYNVLYPGKVINLSGAAIPDGDSGDWIVTGADHILKPSGTRAAVDDTYVTRLTLCRNTKDTTLVPYIKSVQPVVPEIVTCRLQANKWIATQMATITQGIES
jgi:hypothetical protein